MKNSEKKIIFLIIYSIQAFITSKILDVEFFKIKDGSFAIKI